MRAVIASTSPPDGDRTTTTRTRPTRADVPRPATAPRRCPIAGDGARYQLPRETNDVDSPLTDPSPLFDRRSLVSLLLATVAGLMTSNPANAVAFPPASITGTGDPSAVYRGPITVTRQPEAPNGERQTRCLLFCLDIDIDGTALLRFDDIDGPEYDTSLILPAEIAGPLAAVFNGPPA